MEGTNHSRSLVCSETGAIELFKSYTRTKEVESEGKTKVGEKAEGNDILMVEAQEECKSHNQ